ncbi:MAG: glycoside hydrolase family 32 protein [Treponema sp.]|nr:glycoside hydrolase family 32 protein [Candidatus Treponema equi]
MSEKKQDAFIKQSHVLNEIFTDPEQLKLRPKFHLASPCGWINDPNGFSFFHDKVHLFFQYHPYSNKWGPMHWGHAVSEDLLHWDFRPPIMAPDTEADMDGCFSGTAIDDNGLHLIVYTGVIKDNTVQNQCLAYGNGLRYKKDPSNPVITAANIPFEIDRAHFRDPKIWKEDGVYYVAAVVKTQDKSGALLLFKSVDLSDWEFVSIIDRSDCKLGMMWECPDIFSLDGTDVIILSPQEMKENLEEGWHDGNNSVYMTGSLPRDTWKFQRQNVCQIDYGIDFYAPQTALLPDGRRVMVAWMHSWENFSTPDDYLWTGMMTLPRQLEIRNGVMYQKPVKEIEGLRASKASGSLVLETGAWKGAEGVKGRHFDLEVKLAGVSKACGRFFIRFACDKTHGTEIGVDFENQEIWFNRSQSGTRIDCGCFRKFRFEMPQDGVMNLRLICDINSAELFACDGRYVFTNVFYTPIEANEIAFASTPSISMEYDFHTLK